MAAALHAAIVVLLLGVLLIFWCLDLIVDD
jgi:hypothetical protein